MRKELTRVIYEKDSAVARIILNYPEHLNVWDFPGMGGLVDGFIAALDLAEEDDDVKVVILKGAGRAFSAGHDLKTVGFIYGMGTGKPGERRPSQRARFKVDIGFWGKVHERWFLFPKITIAQIHGHCIGEGLIFAEECDLSVAAEDALLGHTEQRIGPAGGAVPTIPILIATIGLKRALDLYITGRQLSGSEAERIGLVNRAVPPEKLGEEVERMAKAACLLPKDGIVIGKLARRQAYNAMGLTSGFTDGPISHTILTNIRWETDEYNFFKQRRDQGVKTGFHGRDARFEGLV